MIKRLKDKSLSNNNKKMKTNKQDNSGSNNNIVINNKTMPYEDWTKFKLLKNSKFPSDEWAKRNKYKWNTTKHKKGNWGCPTGKLNNVIGFDPDFYKWNEDHPFYKFMDGKEWEYYIKKWDTFTTKTPNGGLHFYFTYNKLPQINSDLEIDIKSDGGYLVGPGSKILKNDGKSIGEYIVANNSPVKDMPEELYNWLYNNLNYPHNKKTKIKTKKGGSEKALNPQQIGYYRYDFTDNEVLKILEKLPEKYILKHGDWLKTATAMKSINKVELFLKFCLDHPKTKAKTKGDHYYNKNVELINGITSHNDLHMINHLLLNTDIPNARTMLDYVKYKPTFKGTYIKEPKILKEADKLGKHMEIKENKNYVIKSDTGTGKTTIAKDYIKKYNKQVISIVSRISLGDAQYETFNEYGINCLNYRLVEDCPIEDGDNIIITIDSIKRLNRLNPSNYILFLDEYNSLIEYLITCPNLKDKRVICFKFLLKLMKECDQIIAVDADITPATLKMLDYAGRDYKFINNTYKHNNGCQSSEIFNYDLFIAQVLAEKEALVCCDSKNESEVIFNDKIKEELKHGTLVKEEKQEGETKEEETENKWQKYIYHIKDGDGVIRKYALITSDTDEMLDLDDFDFVVFSPKIIYGLDSQKERPVYCHYKEHTISPKAMLQQICRCRNITYLKYIFYRKEFKEEKYKTLKEVEKETKALEELAIFELMCTEEENILYNEMFNIITYNTDAYNTNKFGHYKVGLRDKGFTDRTDYFQTSKQKIQEKAKENKEKKYDEFSCDNPIYNKINEYLELPKHEWKNHKEIFIEQAQLNKHFNIQTYFFKSSEEWDKDIKAAEEFNANKVRSSKSKFLFIKKIMTEFKITSKDNIKVVKGTTDEKGKAIYKEYKLLFRDRGKKDLDLKIPTECEKLIARIYKKTFGEDIVQAERKTIGGKKINEYNFNWEKLYKHRDISQYKYPGIKRGEMDLTFGKESDLIDYAQPEYIKKQLLSELKILNTKNNNNGIKYFNHFKIDELDP